MWVDWCLLPGTVLELADNVPDTDSLAYFVLPRIFDSTHVLDNFENWWKETQLKQRFRVLHHAALSVNWHYVYISGKSTDEREKYFILVPPWWLDYEEGHLLVLPTLMDSAYRYTLAFCAKHCSLQFCIAVADDCALTLQSIFTTALVGARFNIYLHVWLSHGYCLLTGFTSLAVSCVRFCGECWNIFRLTRFLIRFKGDSFCLPLQQREVAWRRGLCRDVPEHRLEWSRARCSCSWDNNGYKGCQWRAR